jgi:hypothetical protein
LIAGCGGGDSNVTVVSNNPTPAGRTVSGTVLMPNGQLAQFDASLLQRFAALAVREADALTGNVSPVGRNIRVTLTLRTNDGRTQDYGSALTNDQGQYQLSLPAGTDANTCRYIVSVGDLASETLTRAFVFSTSEPVNIDFASEAVVRMIMSQVAAGTDLCSFSPATIAATVQAVNTLPGTLTCTQPDGSPDPEHKCVRDYNYQAVRTATAAPPIQATLGIAAATPTPTAATQTPTRTPTSTTPVATQTPTQTSSPTAPAPTQSVTTTPTGVTPTSSAPPSETPTATPPPPTPTLTPTATWTSTPAATPTATAPVTPPQITIGSVPGAPGTSVNVPISLAKNGLPIVTIAPLVFGFDANVLSFVACTTGVAGASISAVSPAGGQVNVVLTHTVPEGAAAALPVLPEGTVAECTFAISASASAGSTALTFIGAQTADAAGTEYSASGTNGAVTITAAGTLTATPATATPATATPTVPPTDTPTITPPATPTLTPTATWTSTPPATPTATAPATVPQITIGSVPGAPGTSVNVPISLAKNGVPIVTIAPLVFGFDANVLSFVSCTTGVAGASISAVSPASGQVNVVLTHAVPEGGAAAVLPVLPEGTVAQCTFAISAGASAGSTPLSFIGAETADGAGTEYSASGTNGAVTITAAGTPTATPTGPSLSLGTGQGPVGGQATVPITLAKNGVPIVTIAPLVFGFDANVLSFVSCTTGVAGASISAVSPAGGQVNVVLTHAVPEGGAAAALPVLPEGTVAQCTFAISAGASAGSTPLSFIGAETADGAGTEYSASGTNGAVTITAAGTPTATPTGPSISLGSVSGARGTSVNVPIALAKNGLQIVTIAPLVFGFDANVLGFVGCTTGVAGASISAVSPAGGQVNVVLTHAVPEGGAAAVLPVLPEGTIAQCTFTISAGASAGSTALTFIGAETADAAGTEYSANGSPGSVTVQ